MLHANGVASTVLDHDAEQIETMRPFGWRAFYGDATRLDLLRTAGAAKARVLVLAIDDVEQSLKAARLAQEHFPQLAIVARARTVQHCLRLREIGVRLIERETLDSTLMSARSALEQLGWQPHHARAIAMHFRRHTIRQLEELLPHLRDEARYIALARAGRQQLEQLFADECHRRRPGRREGWSDEPPPTP